MGVRYTLQNTLLKKKKSFLKRLFDKHLEFIVIVKSPCLAIVRIGTHGKQIREVLESPGPGVRQALGRVPALPLPSFGNLGDLTSLSHYLICEIGIVEATSKKGECYLR